MKMQSISAICERLYIKGMIILTATHAKVTLNLTQDSFFIQVKGSKTQDTHHFWS